MRSVKPQTKAELAAFGYFALGQAVADDQGRFVLPMPEVEETTISFGAWRDGTKAATFLSSDTETFWPGKSIEGVTVTIRQ